MSTGKLQVPTVTKKITKMTAVIRLKRRLEDEPLEVVIFNCKRLKTEENDAPELSTVLKLAGTIENPEEDFLTNLKKPTKAELEDQFKKHSVDIAAKLRTQKTLDSKNSRYKIVNCFRSNSSEPKATEELTIFDIETSDPDTSDNNKNNYVYDLYYTHSDDLGEMHLEDYISMYPCDELMFGSARDNGVNRVDSDDESEDSNAESNWKNDYPDESDMESVTEDDMVKAMHRCDLSDLSSDDGEEGFIYSVDSEAAGFEEDIDDSDVQRYGERYARFKARHKKDNVQSGSMSQDLYYGDIDEEEYYY